MGIGRSGQGRHPALFVAVIVCGMQRPGYHFCTSPQALLLSSKWTAALWGAGSAAPQQLREQGPGSRGHCPAVGTPVAAPRLSQNVIVHQAWPAALSLLTLPWPEGALLEFLLMLNGLQEPWCKRGPEMPEAWLCLRPGPAGG